MPQKKLHPDFIPDGEEPDDITDSSKWELRPDGTKKGSGYLGVFKTPSGQDMSEFSIADSENSKLRGPKGEYLDYPTLVPTLTKDELNKLINYKEGDVIPDSIKQKAEAHALKRIEKGEPIFATEGEQNTNLFPDISRVSIKSTKTAKSSTNLHPDFIPDPNEEEGQDVSSDEPSAWQSLTSGVSSWINEHPSIRRAIHGPTDEERALEQNPHYPFKDASRTELARNYLETPERGIISYKGKDIGSMYDELRNRNTDIYAGQPWKAAVASLATEPARFLTELANDPFVLASGGPGRVFSKAGGAYGDLKAARARVPQVTDLGTAPSTQKLLGPGPRFQAEPVEADVADTKVGESIPIRQSREIPYRPTTDIVSGDISPVRTEPFPYKTPQPEIPTGRLAQSYSTAYGDTPRAIEARRRFAEQASREPITDESRLLPEGVRQPQTTDLLINEEGKLPGEMSRADALMYEPEFKPWRGLSNLSEAILGRDIMKRDINAGLDPFRGPIDWGPASSGETSETPLISSRPKEVESKPTAKFKGWQQTGYEDMPDFPLYDVVAPGHESHGTTTDAAGLKKLGIEPPSDIPPNPNAVAIIPKTGKIGPYADATVDELIAAVKDGKKPSAILENIPDQRLGIFKAKAKMAGLHITENPLVEGEPIISKDPEIGNQLAASLTDKNHETTGKLLGYSDEDIQAFKDNEVRLDKLESGDEGERQNFFQRLADERGSISITKGSEGFSEGPKGETARTLIRNLQGKLRGIFAGDSQTLEELNKAIANDTSGIIKNKIVPARLNSVIEELKDRANWARRNLTHDNVTGQKAEMESTAKYLETLADELSNSSEDPAKLLYKTRAILEQNPETFQLKSTNPSLTERLKSERGSAPVGRGGKPKKSEASKAPEQPKTPVQSALKKLANSVISSKGLREEQELIYKKERARRFAAFGNVKTTGEAGARESLGKLKGEMPKLNIEELQLTPVERDSLFDAIKQSNISNGEKATGYQALYKLLAGGHVPQRGELHILDTVFGGGMGMEGGPGAASEYEILSNILKAAAEPAKMRPIKESSMARQIYEISRGLMSVDIPFMSSAAFRQGVGLAGTARWFQAVGEQARVFGSEKVYDKIMKDLDNNMIHIRRVTWNPEKQRSELKSIADQIGLKTSDLKNLTRREEQIRAILAEKIPAYGEYIRASNRSYTVMLNSLRTHTAEDWIKAANILDKNGNITDLAKARRIGYTINELSGGSSLDIDKPFSRFTGSGKGLKLDKFSDELSLLFFSPKMLMRDVRMINPLNYIKTDKIERLEYLKGALRRAGVWAGFTGLAALSLGAVVSSNITSSDFAKARIKDTRADAGSGLLQWMVLIARQALGKNTSSTSGRTTELGSTVVSPTRMDLLIQFAINRLHPTLGLGALALTATRTRPFYPISSVVEHVTPMYTSDIHDLMNSDPEIRQIILGLAAGSLSMGSITYGREDYGKPQYKIPYDPKFEGGMFGGSKRNPPIRRMNLSF